MSAYSGILIAAALGLIPVGAQAAAINYTQDTTDFASLPSIISNATPTSETFSRPQQLATAPKERCLVRSSSCVSPFDFATSVLQNRAF